MVVSDAFFSVLQGIAGFMLVDICLIRMLEYLPAAIALSVLNRENVLERGRAMFD